MKRTTNVSSDLSFTRVLIVAHKRIEPNFLTHVQTQITRDGLTSIIARDTLPIAPDRQIHSIHTHANHRTREQSVRSKSAIPRANVGVVEGRTGTAVGVAGRKVGRGVGDRGGTNSISNCSRPGAQPKSVESTNPIVDCESSRRSHANNHRRVTTIIQAPSSMCKRLWYLYAPNISPAR